MTLVARELSKLEIARYPEDMREPVLKGGLRDKMFSSIKKNSARLSRKSRSGAEGEGQEGAGKNRGIGASCQICGGVGRTMEIGAGNGGGAAAFDNRETRQRQDKNRRHQGADSFLEKGLKPKYTSSIGEFFAGGKSFLLAEMTEKLRAIFSL